MTTSALETIIFEEVVKAVSKRAFWTAFAERTLGVDGVDALDEGYLAEAEYFNTLTEEQQAVYSDSQIIMEEVAEYENV